MTDKYITKFIDSYNQEHTINKDYLTDMSHDKLVELAIEMCDNGLMWKRMHERNLDSFSMFIKAG